MQSRTEHLYVEIQIFLGFHLLRTIYISKDILSQYRVTVERSLKCFWGLLFCVGLIQICKILIRNEALCLIEVNRKFSDPRGIHLIVWLFGVLTIEIERFMLV